MKIMVVIPMRPYRIWLARCSPQSVQYRHLTNGIIVERNGQKEVQILCDEKRAKEIIDYAARICPEIAPFIRRSLIQKSSAPHEQKVWRVRARGIEIFETAGKGTCAAMAGAMSNVSTASMSIGTMRHVSTVHLRVAGTTPSLKTAANYSDPEPCYDSWALASLVRDRRCLVMCRRTITGQSIVDQIGHMKSQNRDV